MSNDHYLSTRTIKSITKSRRSSATDEKPSSRRSSLATAISLLSIPGFVDCVSPLVSTLDVHALYKSRISKRNKKLDYFFGEPTPADVCISEIRREGLKAILESKVPLCYFLYYLLEEYNSENLCFFLEVEYFERMSGKKQEMMAHNIYDRFISSKSEFFEINIDERVRRAIRLSNIHSDMFSEAKACVYLFLETSFIRFQHTKVFEDMVTHCGEYKVCYSDRRTKKAIDYLLNYPFTKKHHQRYHSLVQAIIRKYIKCRFEDNQTVQKWLLQQQQQK